LDPSGKSLSISKINDKLVYSVRTEFSNLKLLKRQKGKISFQSITKGTAKVFTPSISPDGNWIVYSKGGDVKNTNLFIASLSGGFEKQLTFFNSCNLSPAWSPDGKEIVFNSNEDGVYKVWKVSSNGGQPKPYSESKTNVGGGVYWPSENEILFQTDDYLNFHFLNLKTEKERPLFRLDSIDSLSFFSKLYFSPNKNYIALNWYRYAEKGKNSRVNGLWLISLIDFSQMLLSENLSPKGWSDDGQWIYAKVVGENKIVKINIKTKKEIAIFSLPVLGLLIYQRMAPLFC